MISQENQFGKAVNVDVGVGLSIGVNSGNFTTEKGGKVTVVLGVDVLLGEIVALGRTSVGDGPGVLVGSAVNIGMILVGMAV